MAELLDHDLPNEFMNADDLAQIELAARKVLGIP